MQRYKIEGITCPLCQKQVGTAIANVPGVALVDVDMAKSIAEVEGEPLPTDVMAAVAALGLTIVPID